MEVKCSLAYLHQAGITRHAFEYTELKFVSNFFKEFNKKVIIQYHLKKRLFIRFKKQYCGVKSTKQKSVGIRLTQHKELDNRNIPSGS